MANPPDHPEPGPKLGDMPTNLGVSAGSSTEGASPPPNTPMPGDRFGEDDRFEIVEKLGAGGMGHVFRAVDWHLDRTVAIKFILQTRGMPLEQLITMIRGEAKATAKLNHENIVAIFDMDAFQGMPFLVMELLDGQSLDVMLERSRMRPLRAIEIMTQVARGLAHAHAHGIVHRDLKPSNVFILRDGRAKILDFGISHFEPLKAPREVRDVMPTVVGFGTPAFMAPEQLRGQPQDARTDIWAAGVMFYQMLTGRLPYTVPELLLRFQSGARVSLAPSVRLLVPSLPEEADRLVATALSDDPAGRFQTARDMVEALRELESAIARRASDAQVAVSASQSERRPVTILACHLEAPDSLDLDEMVDADQHFFYQAAVDAVTQADGCLGTPVGGKFFCCFGYPRVKANDAERAVLASLRIVEVMRERARQSNADLHFTIGIHSGVAGLSAMPGPAQILPAVQGNVPNLASRMARTATPGSVVMSQATFELTSGLFDTRPVTMLVEGKSSAAVHEVLRENEGLSRFERTFSPEVASMVGRDHELGLLRRLWEDAKEGHGQIVVVSGEPGIGKSRLVQELKDLVIEEHNTRLTCQCRPHFKNSAFHPLVELILRSMAIQRDDPPEKKLEKVERNLTALGFSLPEAVPLFGALLSIPFERTYAPLGLAPEHQKLKTLEALVAMLLRTTLNRPALFIIEDMHWVDHSTIEYLGAVIDLLPSSRALFVLTSRPEFHVPWSRRRHLHQLTLEKLPPASMLSIVKQASKDKRLSPEMIERLVATSDGVPLFGEELTRMVIESWQPGDMGQTRRMPIPGTLHELLVARLDLLRGVGKEVAQVASILGRDFHYEFLRHVAPLDDISLQQGLDMLADAGILHHAGRAADSKYVFKHALIQQTAYESLVKSERQRHHQRAAQVLSEIFPETAESEPELVAHHYYEAGNWREAIGFWEKAGQRATERSALVEAIHHYSQARELLKTLPESPDRDKKELAVLLALGSPLMSVHGYASPEVEQNYARARELARAAGGQAEIFPAMQGLWQFYYVRGMLPTSRKLGHQLLEIAEESPNSTFFLLAHRAVASSAFLQGDYATCRAHAQAGFDLYDMREHGSLAVRTGHDPGVAHGVYLAWSLWMLGYADQALARVSEMVDLSKRLGHPMTMAYALCFAALIRNHRGEHDEAKVLSEAALEITVPNKFALWTAWAKLQWGWGMAGTNDYDHGIPLMKTGLEEWKSTGARVGFTFFPVTLAEMCLRHGQEAETARLLEEAEPMVASNDEHFYEPELLRLKGELSLAGMSQGDDARATAAAYFDRGIEVARALSGRAWELRLAMSRARLLANQGQVAKAADALGGTLAWFTEGFETADLRVARAEVEVWQAAVSS
jgi:TOMM system kinase/cyclase fusion protein